MFEYIFDRWYNINPRTLHSRADKKMICVCFYFEVKASRLQDYSSFVSQLLHAQLRKWRSAVQHQQQSGNHRPAAETKTHNDTTTPPRPLGFISWMFLQSTNPNPTSTQEQQLIRTELSCRHVWG